jgi:oligopeptidase B
LLLYAYGSYGYNGYVLSSTRLSILDRGFAIAHIRGEDLGRQWYEDGKLLKRKYFTDFIDCF